MAEVGESSGAKPSGEIWAKLVPSDSRFPDVEIRDLVLTQDTPQSQDIGSDESLVCSPIDKCEWCRITRNPDQSSATIQNKSSNAILVDGAAIQSEESTVIRSGSEIITGLEREGCLSYRFNVLLGPETCQKMLKISVDAEHAKCCICLNIWHDAVTIAPCFHNFCNGCFSEWLRRSQEKRSSVLCPQCRAVVQFVGRNHFLHNIADEISVSLYIASLTPLGALRFKQASDSRHIFASSQNLPPFAAARFTMPSIADRSVELESNAVGSAGVSTPPKRRLRSNSSPMKLSPMKCKRVGISSVAKLRSVEVESERSVEEVVGSGGDLTPQKRKLRSDSSSPMKPRPVSSPMKCKSARRNLSACTSTPANGIEKYFSQKKPQAFCKPPVVVKPNWNPRDKEQMRIVKEALHLSTVPSTVACRDVEQNRVLEFCKSCIEQEKAGSLYVCGCPGTGKSLSMGKVKQLLVNWAGEGGFQEPDVLELNCTSLTKTSDIFAKILGKYQPQKKANGTTSLQLLQKLYSQKPQSDGTRMMLIIADELDYLITKDRAVLHDLFMLTTYPFSRCILLGVANAIDLADRFVPKLQSLNCKPMVITFRAYSKDQILKILQERLMALPYTVFQPHALELCARKVAAASGDMRKALCISRSAIEMLEAELRESTDKLNSSTAENPFSEQQTAPALALVKKQEIDIVRIDHMAIALSKTFKSPVVDTIQCLPQHQQIIMCSAAKHFRGVKKDTTIGELNKSYFDICKATLIPPVGSFEFSSMCKVLNDQGLLKLSGQSRDIKSKRVTLNVDEGDITFALQGIRFFRTCLE